MLFNEGNKRLNRIIFTVLVRCNFRMGHELVPARCECGSLTWRVNSFDNLFELFNNRYARTNELVALPVRIT